MSAVSGELNILILSGRLVPCEIKKCKVITRKNPRVIPMICFFCDATCL